MDTEADFLGEYAEYQHGFSDPENYVYKAPKGLNKEIVREISKMKRPFII